MISIRGMVGESVTGTLVSVGLFGDAMPLPMVMMPQQMLNICGSYVDALQEMHKVMALGSGLN